jgi:hypothetical protein
MRGFRVFKAVKVLAMVCVAAAVFGMVTMLLWNGLAPAIFGLKTITFLQALGLVVLCRVLFGGFHRRGGGCRGGRRAWKERLAERWMEMSPEERERFRAGMGGRWGCGFGRESEAAAEKKVEG